MVRKLFLRLLPVQILLASIQAVNGIVTGLYGSNFIGEGAMSAVGLYAPVNMAFLAISTVLLGGTQVLCGKYMGKDQVERTNDIFSVDMVIVVVLGAVAGGLMVMFAEPFARLLGANDAAAEHLIPYVKGMGVAILPLIGTQQLSAFLSLEQRNRRTSVGSAVYIIANAVFGYIFVAHMKMGAIGLSLASAAALWLFLLILGQFYVSGKSVIKFKASGIHLSDVGGIIKTGYAGALSFTYQVVRGFAFNAIIILYIGNAGLASLATYSVINGLLWAVPAGILAVGRLLMSISYGEEDRDNLIRVMKTTLFSYAPIVLGLGALVAFLSGPIATLYYHDTTSSVHMMTKMALVIVPLSLPLSLICVSFVNWGQIVGHAILVHVLSILDGVVGTVVFAWFATPIIGMNGIWLSYVFNGVITTVVIFIYAWARKKVIPATVERLMVIPGGFGVIRGDSMEIVLSDIRDVSKTAETIQSFCRTRGVDDRRSYLAGLAMEEMAGNVLEHGFKKDNKRHEVDVKVVHKQGDVILRIKDDCVAFDPEERREIVDPNDPASNIGIRMTYKLAKEVNYHHLLGINVLTIKI